MVGLVGFAIVVCGPFGFAVGWVIGNRLSVAAGLVAGFAAVIGWFVVAGILLTLVLSTQNCTDCNEAAWALILDPLATIGFVVGLVPGVVAGRRGREPHAPPPTG